MSYWVFTDQAAANSAQDAATNALPEDTSIGGQATPIQITDKWADVLALTDGRFAFAVRTGMAVPSGASVVSDISALLPVTPRVP